MIRAVAPTERLVNDFLRQVLERVVDLVLAHVALAHQDVDQVFARRFEPRLEECRGFGVQPADPTQVFQERIGGRMAPIAGSDQEPVGEIERGDRGPARQAQQTGLLLHRDQLQDFGESEFGQ